MKKLELSLPSVAANLALDEAILDAASDLGDILRIWESPHRAVILGRATRVAEEVDREYCERHGVPILRRCSGGASVVIGPGCLMYSIVLDTRERPDLHVVDHAHQFVLAGLARALQSAGCEVTMSGTSDLTLGDRKFSGNSLRCKQHSLLYHGTLLYDADLGEIQRCLRMPPRKPVYRRERDHLDFLTNLPSSASVIAQRLVDAWQVDDTLPRDALSGLLAKLPEYLTMRYENDEWNFSR
jgi:lipoate-protein ligase A